MKLCFATNNTHKINEVKSLLQGKIALMSLKEIGCFEELAETSGTIRGNSGQKAEYVFNNYRVDCFADDSGLEVEALKGAPGVDSAIYAGLQRSHEDNIRLLLKNIGGMPNRKARFVTVITLYLDGKVQQFEGEVKGEILLEKRGTGGFGYDPIFKPDGFSTTLAEMSVEEKNKISHRAKAIGKLVKFINSHFES
jgi:XTP/dITP diphosphohydrolase